MTATSAIGSSPLSTSSRALRGFTLIELLVALSIMVLIAAAVPMVLAHLVPARRIVATADRLIADVRWLQGEAIRARTPGRLTVHPAGYRLEVGERVRDVVVGDETHLQLRAPDQARALSQLMFFPDGTANPAHVSVMDSGRTVKVEVSLLTARVRRLP